MPVQFQIEDLANYLHVTASGTTDNLAEAKVYSQSINEAVKKYNATNLLCDERNVKHSLSVLEIFMLGEHHAENSPYRVKMAVVYKSSGMADGRFLETVAKNRGLMMHITDNYQEALDWIQIDR